jgi:hypothetical protein
MGRLHLHQRSGLNIYHLLRGCDGLGGNQFRAYSRMLCVRAPLHAPHIGRRRLLSYPYLLYGSTLAAGHLFVWCTTVINLLVGALVIVMAYAGIFGVSWPDRVVAAL